ncbi:MAG: type II toxin-antitoxin system VapC family toxin [Chloroflexi bacterium]|nr:type II toxin-antitoxin system VapC family toxin [Chloroflexota bacterium]
MTRRYGIDTSVLVRLITGQPSDAFAHCVEQLRTLVEEDGAEIFASNQVVGEAYITTQHHYGLSGDQVRAALLATLQSGLLAPQQGRSVLDALEASGGPGLMDRLIAGEYASAGLEVLTLDRKMARLPGSTRL